MFVIAICAGLIGSASVAQTRKQTAIFAISSEGVDGSMDALAVVEEKRLRSPYTDKQPDRETFANAYFKKTNTYRLIFGGGDAGTATVTKWSEGCNNIHAQVNLSTSARLGGKVMALATNSETLGKRSISRRPPTDAERSATLTLMKSIYQQNRTPASLMNSIKVTNLTATDLNGDGKYEMIGSFMLTGKNKFERDLFLIATPQGASMRAEFVKFQAYQPPPEGFLSSIDFVDQLDIDGDGVGEVFATQGGFDGYQYLVFKKINGRWRKIFDMIGDAC
ncbi:MAG TPA: hypothetical protein VE863_09195 [Pyrinomonadaceae bacterium]|jgi:hypothetical protein|nr:hypothetical protein [Pyrinomonadaceae bacterium]